MGSTGSGSFSDYSGSSNSKGSGGAGGSGGSSGVDRCTLAFSCALEEIAKCDYFKNHGVPPPVGTALAIQLKGRLFATDSIGLSVGALPTSLNYLAACLSANYVYVGVITASATKPVIALTADFKPK